jgi:predicted small secreted protein
MKKLNYVSLAVLIAAALIAGCKERGSCALLGP